MFPYEVILHIASFLNNPIDLRNLALTNHSINDLIKKYIISKEKWTPCKIDTDKEFIFKCFREGSRNLKYNGKIDLVFNVIKFTDYSQIITSCEIISNFKNILNGEKNTIYILVEAPYNHKKTFKDLKI